MSNRSANRSIICAHRGRLCGSIVADGRSIPNFVCDHPCHRTTTEAACLICPDYAARAGLDEKSANPKVRPNPPSLCRPSPPDKIFYLPTGQSRDDHRAIDPTNLFRGGTVFLVLGGPSVREANLTRLAARGVCIASYNNNPAVLPSPIRPHIWFHTDTAAKFHDSIWRDPSMLKFSPTREWRSGKGRKGRAWKNVMRRKLGGGFERSDCLAVDLPGVIGYTRNSTFRPEYWLTEGTINRGNDKRSAARNGFPHVINSMFTAIRLLYILGFSTVYLVGCDFRMSYGQPYAFDQGKSQGGVNANNEAYKKMDAMFHLLAPQLAAAGLLAYNTTANSGLTAWPYRAFDDAVDSVAGQFEQELDARGWYDD